MRITILVDNKATLNGTIPAWGFSAYVESKKTRILVDTGPNFRTLENNAKITGVNLDEVSAVFISHLHSDHYGALEVLLNRFKLEIPVFIPSKRFWSKKFRFGKLIIVDKSMRIIDDMYSTGPLGSWLTEHSLIVKINDIFSVLVTGCAHPGIVKILEFTTKILGFNVVGVIGGMHLLGKSYFELERIVEKISSYGVKIICPCHCSDDDFLKVLLEKFSGEVYPCGCGVTIDLDV
jgi:7,8-dihydropterin-6-yl-methyl-4-(beta-D-ribofuranosyl)aminobenzene 5'-phosphate synthase